MKKVLMTILKIVFIVIIIVGIIKFGIELYRFCVAQRVIDQAEESLNGLSFDLQNGELMKYAGEMRGTQVRQLINKVNYLKAKWPIPLNYAEGSIHTTEEIKSGGATYLVSLETDEETGYVTSVMIVAQPTKVQEGDES